MDSATIAGLVDHYHHVIDDDALLYNAPNGLDVKDRQRLESSGIDVTRRWTDLPTFKPTWRYDPRFLTSNKVNRGARKVLEAFATGGLKGTAFFDVDYAIMGRDAQYDVDKKAAELSTLEGIGFVATHYVELQDRSIHLDEIKKKNNSRENFELGQRLFKLALEMILINAQSLIIPERDDEFRKIAAKNQADLTESDFDYALHSIQDELYKLIVDPLTIHFAPLEFEHQKTNDIQSGEDRMLFIYKIIAALSHIAPETKIKINLKNFFDFNFSDHVYAGVVEYIRLIQATGCEAIAITRGNQLPFMCEFDHGLSGLFDKVYSTLLWVNRNPDGEYTEIFYRDKAIRPYSTEIVKLSTNDKLKIIVHESIVKLVDAGITFNKPLELIGGLTTYLDHCRTTTDTDDELRGTTPTTEVIGPRNATREQRAHMYANNIPWPDIVVNPKKYVNMIAEMGIPQIDSFSMSNIPIRNSVVNFATGKPQHALILD